MSTKTKKTQKRRLALPAALIRNIEDARKNLKTVQDRSVKEVRGLYSKVIEIDFVKKVRKNDIVKRATKASNEISHEVESRVRKLVKEIESNAKNIRELLPVPTRAEVEKLARKVNELARRLDDIAGDEKKSAAN